MDGDLKPTPGMPRIQQLPKNGSVGVLKPCSTTRNGHTHRWATGRPRWRSLCREGPCCRVIQAQPAQISRPLPCCTNVLHGPPNGGWTPVPSETADTAPTQRDRHLQCIAEHGRASWQKVSGYTKRARAEAAIGRFKQVIGDGLRSHTDELGVRGERRRPCP
jgi:hypothetical protein